jgi:type VI secretion system protein
VAIVDFSTNGTFLNYGKLALGPTPTPLNDGDVISIGPYEILIEITFDEKDTVIAEPVEESQISPGLALSAPNILAAERDDSDLLDDLFNEGKGLSGPGAVDRAETDEANFLYPLDDVLARTSLNPFESDEVRSYSHNPAGQDHFKSPNVEHPVGTIPDDWDDMLSPQPNSSNNSIDPVNVLKSDNVPNVEKPLISGENTQKIVPNERN